MAVNTFQTPAGRIGKYKGEIIKPILGREVLSLACDTKSFPKNSSDTVVFRQYLNYGATASSPGTFFSTTATTDRSQDYVNAHLASDGITPNAESITPRDITAVMNAYSVLYGYTKRVVDLGEDDVSGPMKTMVGNRLGLVRELVRFGQAKACTNKFYGGIGTSRATVNGPISLKILQRMQRTLDAQHAEKMSEVVSASGKYDTHAIEPSYFVIIHTDLKPDVRNLPGFVPVAKYGSMSAISPYEFGCVDEFRFFSSPELVSVLDAGANAAGLGLSTAATKVDVYQVVMTGKGALGDVTIKSKDAIEIHDVRPSQLSKSDPTGERGYIGASCYFTAVLQNNMHMAIAEVGASDLK